MKIKRIISFLLAVILIFTAAAGLFSVYAKEKTPVFSKEAVTDFRQYGAKEDSVTLKWSAVENSKGYEIQMKKNGEYIGISKTAKTAYTLSDLKSGKVCYLRLRAYAKEDGKIINGRWSYIHACTKPSAVTVKKSGSDNRIVTVTWKKLSCSGYQIQYGTKSDFSGHKGKVLSGSDVTSFVTKKLSANTKYYFRIRSYMNCGAKNYYSPWTQFTVKTDAGYKTTSKGYKIETINGVTYVDGVLIANKTYSIPENYYPGGLTKECNEAFNKMKAAAARDGVNLFIVSGFRSYETQKNLYNRYVAKDGKALADTYSARPGTSEHQTGLAMDLNSLKGSFGETKEGRWLANNCHKYGFIIRYPKGKQNITGYIYEPWHVRYLGTDTATKIYKSGLCLEEYYGITSKYN